MSTASGERSRQGELSQTSLSEQVSAPVKGHKVTSPRKRLEAANTMIRTGRSACVQGGTPLANCRATFKIWIIQLSRLCLRMAVEQLHCLTTCISASIPQARRSPESAPPPHRRGPREHSQLPAGPTNPSRVSLREARQRGPATPPPPGAPRAGGGHRKRGGPGRGPERARQRGDRYLPPARGGRPRPAVSRWRRSRAAGLAGSGRRGRTGFPRGRRPRRSPGTG